MQLVPTTMALPAVTTFEECADFSQTVGPFLPQLYELPQKLLNSYWNRDELLQLYIATNPMISALALGLALFPIVWIASEVNRNYSQIDRLWSILPAIFIGHFVAYGHVVGLDTERLNTLLVAVVIWSVSFPEEGSRSAANVEIGSVNFQLLATRRLQHWL
jgi:hypothetical protein